MPAIPTYQRRVLPTGVLSVGSTQTGGEYVGDTISRVGSGLGDVASGLNQQQDAEFRKRQADSLVAADVDFQVFQERFSTYLKQRQDTAPLDVQNFAPDIAKEYDKQQSELLAKHRDPRALMILKGRGMAFRERVISDAGTFEAGQGVKNRLVKVGESGNLRENQVRTNPTLYAEARQQQDALIQEAALGPDETRKQLLQNRERMAVAAVTAMAEADPMKMMQALHSAPGKSGVQAIEDLSPDGRNALLQFSRAEFSRLVAARAAQDAAEERNQRERHEAGSRILTAKLLKGGLTQSDLQAAVEGDRIDPSEARTLAAAMKNGDVSTSPEALFNAEATLSELTPDDIRHLPDVSWKDRSDLLTKWQTLDKAWADSNEFQQGRSRIDNALGIVPGTVMGSLSADDKTKRARAQKEYWDRLSALPLGDRREQSVSIADDIIGRFNVESGKQKAVKLRATLRDLEQKNEGASGAAKAEYDRKRARLLTLIAEAEKP